MCHADDLLYLWDPVDINPEDGPLPQQVDCRFLPPGLLREEYLLGLSATGHHGYSVGQFRKVRPP